jgi:hypothetical protein
MILVLSLKQYPIDELDKRYPVPNFYKKMNYLR